MNIPDPNTDYNVNNSDSMYGLKAFDPEQTRQRQRQLYAQQIQQGMQGARESGLASGSFNPEVSAYNSTQSARNAMNVADVDLDKYTHDDQYKRFQSMLGANQSKLNWADLNEKKREYEDSQPSWLSGLLDAGMGVAGAFLEEGGEVKNSDYFHNNYDGYIPPHEVNSAPFASQPTNDNTLIKAKDGEHIMTDNAVNVFGKDTFDAINNSAKIASQYFNAGGTIPKPLGGNSISQVMPANSMASGAGSAGNTNWYNPQANTATNMGGLIGNTFRKIGGMFADGGMVNDPALGAMPTGVQPNSFADQISALDNNWKATLKSLTDTFGFGAPEVQEAFKQYQLQRQDLTTKSSQQGNQSVEPGVGQQGAQAMANKPAGGGEPMHEHTITIKRKPITPQPTPQQSDDSTMYSSPYSGASY